MRSGSRIAPVAVSLPLILLIAAMYLMPFAGGILSSITDFVRGFFEKPRNYTIDDLRTIARTATKPIYGVEPSTSDLWREWEVLERLALDPMAMSNISRAYSDYRALRWTVAKCSDVLVSNSSISLYCEYAGSLADLRIPPYVSRHIIPIFLSVNYTFYRDSKEIEVRYRVFTDYGWALIAMPSPEKVNASYPMITVDRKIRWKEAPMDFKTVNISLGRENLVRYTVFLPRGVIYPEIIDYGREGREIVFSEQNHRFKVWLGNQTIKEYLRLRGFTEDGRYWEREISLYDIDAVLSPCKNDTIVVKDGSPNLYPLKKDYNLAHLLLWINLYHTVLGEVKYRNIVEQPFKYPIRGCEMGIITIAKLTKDDPTEVGWSISPLSHHPGLNAYGVLAQSIGCKLEGMVISRDPYCFHVVVHEIGHRIIGHTDEIYTAFGSMNMYVPYNISVMSGNAHTNYFEYFIPSLFDIYFLAYAFRVHGFKIYAPVFTLEYPYRAVCLHEYYQYFSIGVDDPSGFLVFPCTYTYYVAFNHSDANARFWMYALQYSNAEKPRTVPGIFSVLASSAIEMSSKARFYFAVARDLAGLKP